MNPRRAAVTILVCVCSLSLAERMVAQGFATEKTIKMQAPVVSSKATKQPADQTRKQSPKTVSSSGFQQPTQAIQKSVGQVPKESKPGHHKPGYLLKAHKKIGPKAVVQPRTDLIPYGMLEDSQRYDPLPRAASSGVPSPQRHDVIQDHFQELDRNQDGKIDPVERAFGRIDIDRDLHSRTLQ